MLELAELRRGDWYGEAMKKPTKQAGLLGSVCFGVLKSLQVFDSGFWYLGIWAKDFMAWDYCQKKQSIWWNQLEASRMSLQTLVDSDVRFVGFSDSDHWSLFISCAPQKRLKHSQSLLGHSRKMSNNFFWKFRGFRTSGPIPGSWKFHPSSIWLRRKRCHELLIDFQCGTRNPNGEGVQ